jgi:PKD repeat protein
MALLLDALDDKLKEFHPEGKIRSSVPKGEAGKVYDLSYDQGTKTLSWSYVNRGDYDFSGEVGLSDLTPIAIYYQAKTGDGIGDDQRERTVDGNGDGEVDIKDINPIALSYLADVASYRILTSSEAGGEYTAIGEIEYAQNGGGHPPKFVIPLPDAAHAFVAVVPLDGSGTPGEQSDPVQVGQRPLIFEVGPSGGKSGAAVVFSASVAGTPPLSYAWSFGDAASPSVAAVPSPTVVLGAAGEYSCSLAVTNKYGLAEYDFEVSVYSAPSAQIRATPASGNPPLVVLLDASGSTAGSGAIVLYEWDADGDGAYESTSGSTPEISATYNTPGVYFPAVRITDSMANQATASTQVRANSAPFADLSVDPRSGAAPLTVVLDASSSLDPDGTIVSYEFDFDGDGAWDTPRQPQSSIQHQYSVPGFYLPSVRVTDSDGASDVEIAADELYISGWRKRTLDSQGFVGKYCSLAEIGGVPAVSYFDIGAGDLKFIAALDELGEAWRPPVLVDSAGTVGSYSSLAEIADAPAISYFDASNSAAKYVRALDSAGSAWGEPVMLASQGSVGANTSLAVIDGRPGVSYLDISNHNFMYVSSFDETGAAWDAPHVAAAGASAGERNSLTEVAGHPAITFVEESSASLAFVRAMDPQGTSWPEPVTIDGTLGAGLYSSLAFVGGAPAVSYFENNQSRLMFAGALDPSGSEWKTPLGLEFGGAGLWSSLATYQAKPAIAYFDSSINRIKFVAALDTAGTMWAAPEVVAQEEAEHLSLAIIAGRPALAYYDPLQLDLRFVVLY